MASKQVRQPGAVQRTGRSPVRSSPSPRKAGQEPSLEREQGLQKQLDELKKAKDAEEKEKKKEEALKKKELTAAKKRIQKEFQSAGKAVKKKEGEVVKLKSAIKKLQGQETMVKKKTAETEVKAKEKLQVTEVKHQDLETQLAQTCAEAAQERVRYQQLQLQLDTLGNNNIDLSKRGQSPGRELGALRDAGEGRGMSELHDSAVETTDAEGEERYAHAESEVARLNQQLEDMRGQFESAEEQKRLLVERLEESERGELGPNSEDIHRECREAIEQLRRELERLREENEGLHTKLGAANKAIEMQEECIEELAGRASGVGEGLMDFASQELARCSIIQSESRLLSAESSHHGSADVTAAVQAEEAGGQRQAPAEEDVAVGDVVRLSGDGRTVREAFRSVGFAWNDLTEGMLGQAFQILEMPKPGIVGLASPDGSQGGVWYFPIGALQKATSQPPTPGSASATASTAATYQRGSFSKGATSSASMQARASTPGRHSSFAGGSVRGSAIGLSGSSGSLAATAPYPVQMRMSSASAPTPPPLRSPSPDSVGKTPASPPSFGGQTSRAAPEASSPTAGVALGGLAPSASLAASSGVFVGSLPADVLDDEIMAEFAKFGVITEMQVQRDDSGPQSSYAFLMYSSREEASRAVEAASGGKLIMPGAAAPCEVGFARGAQMAAAQPVGAQAVAQQAQVVVRCIPNETPDDILTGEFGKYGVVVGLQVQRDPAGLEKSYAVVTYQSRDDAARAVEATSGGKLVLPGATAPCEVSLARISPLASGQLAAARPQLPQAALPQQVIVRAVPVETPDDLLLAEFSKFGAVVDFKVLREPSGPPKSYALVTYQTADEAARAVQVTNGRLLMPGAAAPAQVGFAQLPPFAVGQVMASRHRMAAPGQQVRPQSAPRLRSGPGIVSSSPACAAVLTAGGDVRRQVSGVATAAGAEPAEGVCAWAAPDPRQFIAACPSQLDATAATTQEFDSSHMCHGQPGQSDLSLSATVLQGGRPMAPPRPWQPGMPCEPVAGLAPGGADRRQPSPSGPRYMAAAPGSAPLLVQPGSYVAGALAEHQSLLQVPGQAGRVVAFRSPGRSPGAARPGALPAPGAAQPGVLMAPMPGAAWRGGTPLPTSARLGRQQASPRPNAPSAPGSYTPPALVQSAPGAQSPMANCPGGVLSSSHSGAGARPPCDGASASNLSASTGRAGACFRDAVSKVTARALREFRQNHRVTLTMEQPLL